MRPILFAAVLLLASAGHLHAEDAGAGDSGTFHLPGIVYRILAIWVCYACSRKLWDGYVERKISPWRSLLDFSPRQIFYRDTMPIRYWIEMSQMILGAVSGFLVAILGWWQPNG